MIGSGPEHEKVRMGSVAGVQRGWPVRKSKRARGGRRSALRKPQSLAVAAVVRFSITLRDLATRGELIAGEAARPLAAVRRTIVYNTNCRAAVLVAP